VSQPLLFALSAVGRDRPGIVAAVSAALLAHDVNVEDSQMTILRGHFTMVLVVAAPPSLDAAGLRADLEAVRAHLRLESLSLSEVEQLDAGTDPVASLMVTVYGADHPGILHAFSQAVAQRGIDITDLTTRLAGEQDEPIYALMMELAPPQALDENELRVALERLGRDEGVDVTVRPIDVDTL
jgi:glycine cleavage system transcriptional repressor